MNLFFNLTGGALGMKRVVLSIVFIALLSLVMTVFASNQWTEVSQYRKDPPYVIGWSINNAGISWRTEYIEELKQQAKRLGSVIKDVIILNADSNIAKQIADIEDLVAKGVDALIVDPQSPTALAPVIEQVYEKGIPVVVVNDPIDTENYTCFISTDDFEFGKIAAEWLVRELGGKGNIAVLDGLPGMGIAIERFNGAMSVFNNYPEIKVVAHDYGAWSYDKGKIITQNILAAHPNLDGIWSSGGAMTLGAVDAFLEAGRELIPMTGEALNGFAKRWIELRDKGFTSIAPYKPTWLSAAALEYAVQALEGFPIPKKILYPTPVFTEENIDQIVRWDLPDSYWLGSLLPDDVIKEIFKGQ